MKACFSSVKKLSKLTVLLVSCSFLLTCDTTDAPIETTLLGKWQLTQILADPGDGSGKFRNINSNKTIQFNEDGTVNSNGELCTFTTKPNSADSGTYSIEENKITATCPDSKGLIGFELQNSKLILHYPCFEGCSEKYVKMHSTVLLKE